MNIPIIEPRKPEFNPERLNDGTEKLYHLNKLRSVQNPQMLKVKKKLKFSP